MGLEGHWSLSWLLSAGSGDRRLQNRRFWGWAGSRTHGSGPRRLQNGRFWRRAGSRTDRSGDRPAPERAVLEALFLVIYNTFDIFTCLLGYFVL